MSGWTRRQALAALAAGAVAGCSSGKPRSPLIVENKTDSPATVTVTAWLLADGTRERVVRETFDVDGGGSRRRDDFLTEENHFEIRAETDAGHSDTVDFDVRNGGLGNVVRVLVFDDRVEFNVVFDD